MPVKAKRSTYNYSLPITIKKMRECPGLTWDQGRGSPHTGAEDSGHLDRGRGRSFPREHPALLASTPRGGGGWAAGQVGRWEKPRVFQSTVLTPSQPAS